MSNAQLITQAIGVLLIIIMFFGLINAIYEFYYLGKQEPLTKEQNQARKTLKLILFIPVFFLFVTIFIGLLYLLKFVTDYDITQLIYSTFTTMRDNQTDILRQQQEIQALLLVLHQSQEAPKKNIMTRAKSLLDRAKAAVGGVIDMAKAKKAEPEPLDYF